MTPCHTASRDEARSYTAKTTREILRAREPAISSHRSIVMELLGSHRSVRYESARAPLWHLYHDRVGNDR